MSAASFLGIAGIIAFRDTTDSCSQSDGWWRISLFCSLSLNHAQRRPLYRRMFSPTASTHGLFAPWLHQHSDRQHLLHDCADGRRRRPGYALAERFGISYHTAVIGVGILMIGYVVFGGMLATTWVQIIKAILLMGGTILSILVLAHFHFSLADFFNAVGHVTYHEKGTRGRQRLLQPGLRYKPPYGALELISLGLALIFGTAGLPHILVRFYTVPDAKTARQSVVWAMVLIGSFYIMTTFLGFGAATIVGRDFISTHGGTNMSAPLLAQALAGNIFFAFISAIAFATILAVVAGLTISASTSFAHDLWTNVIHNGVERKPGEEVLVARVSAFVVGAVAITVAILLGPTANVAFLVGFGICCRGLGQPPGDRSLDILAQIQHYWRRRWPCGRAPCFDWTDSGWSQPDGCRSSKRHGRCAPPDPSQSLVSS